MPCFMYIKKKLLASLYLTRSYTIHIVLEAGLEPAQPQWPKDFKSFVSTIPPFEHPKKGKESGKRDSNSRP